MSAILIPISQLSAAQEITGQPSFSVPCRSASTEYMGCNWESCDPAVLDALEHLPGVVIADTWPDVLAKAQAEPIPAPTLDQLLP